MPREYRLGPARRLVNVAVKLLVRVGLGPPHTYLLAVRGRRTGRRFTTPVRLVERDGERWLVAPYGAVAWVKNARAAREVELSRGRRTERAGIAELSAAEAAPVLAEYVRAVAVVRPFFEAGPGSPVEAFAAEAGLHPVFRLRATGA